MRLFDGLEEDARKRLEVKMPEVPDVLGRPGLPPVREGLRDILCSHRNEFTHWRYAYKDPQARYDTALVDEALTAIINAYDESA